MRASTSNDSVIEATLAYTLTTSQQFLDFKVSVRNTILDLSTRCVRM